MRIVFLDFDGVLNSHAYFNARTEKFEDVGEAGELDPSAVERLNRIVDATGALVVVSSSWRYARSRDQLHDLLKSRGYTGTVLDKTPDTDWSETGWRDAHRPAEAHPDFVPTSRQRGDEIRQWLDAHPEVVSFVVLDDDSDMDAVRDRHIKTSLFLGGLLDEHVDRAIAMLTEAT